MENYTNPSLLINPDPEFDYLSEVKEESRIPSDAYYFNPHSKR